MKKKYIGVFARICGAFSVLLFAFMFADVYLLASGVFHLVPWGSAFIYSSIAAITFSIAGIVLSLIEHGVNTEVKFFWYVNLFECFLTFTVYTATWLLLWIISSAGIDVWKTRRLTAFIAALAFPVLLGALVYFSAKRSSPNAKRRSDKSREDIKRAL